MSTVTYTYNRMLEHKNHWSGLCFVSLICVAGLTAGAINLAQYLDSHIFDDAIIAGSCITSAIVVLSIVTLILFIRKRRADRSTDDQLKNLRSNSKLLLISKFASIAFLVLYCSAIIDKAISHKSHVLFGFTFLQLSSILMFAFYVLHCTCYAITRLLDRRQKQEVIHRIRGAVMYIMLNEVQHAILGNMTDSVQKTNIKTMLSDLKQAFDITKSKKTRYIFVGDIRKVEEIFINLCDALYELSETLTTQQDHPDKNNHALLTRLPTSLLYLRTEVGQAIKQDKKLRGLPDQHKKYILKQINSLALQNLIQEVKQKLEASNQEIPKSDNDSSQGIAKTSCESQLYGHLNKLDTKINALKMKITNAMRFTNNGGIEPGTSDDGSNIVAIITAISQCVHDIYVLNNEQNQESQSQSMQQQYNEIIRGACTLCMKVSNYVQVQCCEKDCQPTENLRKHSRETLQAATYALSSTRYQFQQLINDKILKDNDIIDKYDTCTQSFVELSDFINNPPDSSNNNNLIKLVNKAQIELGEISQILQDSCANQLEELEKVEQAGSSQTLQCPSTSQSEQSQILSNRSLHQQKILVFAMNLEEIQDDIDRALSSIKVICNAQKKTSPKGIMCCCLSVNEVLNDGRDCTPNLEPKTQLT